MDITKLARPNILKLKPYSSAREEYSGNAQILLDANENPFGNLNRYPDPIQKALKKEISEWKHIPQENIFIGNGSDEAIDLLIRIFCIPGRDTVTICPPTYGMYEVSAAINDVEVIKIPLTENFEPLTEEILKAGSKIVFLCSPNNPTGNILRGIETIIRDFPGIVVVDEAYQDFAETESFIKNVPEQENLVVLQTFSKAYGLAGARVGMAFAGKEIIDLLTKVKPPYNVSELNQKAALDCLRNREKIQKQKNTILAERSRLEKELKMMPFVKRIFPSQANFLLTEVTDPEGIYKYLVSGGIIVRNRSSVVPGCLRITVGSPEENTKLIRLLLNYPS